uniref:Ig-like domain-containing protein n=1 Tax=Oryzias latipes TaxID=8090 RepID=A0A3P9HIM7_ORYLA
MCRSHLSLLILFILTVFWAQKVEVMSEVTGYVGLDVTLPCSFIQGKESSNVTQSQWDFLSPDGNKTLIMVFNNQHGKGVHESYLKGRVDMDDQSLQIKNVELSDAGSYICTINTFPLGSFHDTTELHVQDDQHNPLLHVSVVLHVIIFSVFSGLLLIVDIFCFKNFPELFFNQKTHIRLCKCALLSLPLTHSASCANRLC